MPPSLSKTKYLCGIQCHKLLWLTVNKPELIPPVSPVQQRIFEQGTEVGILAREQYDGGVLIEAEHNQIPLALQQTEEAVRRGASVIFEGAFVFNNVLVRPDIVERQPGGVWNIIEVKSSTKAKEEHIPDVAVQVYTLEGAGFKIGRKYLMHINNECVYPDLSNLFTLSDITAEVDIELPAVPAKIEAMRRTLSAPDEPDIHIGEQCRKPYECPFIARCWSWVPEYSIYDIPRLKWTQKDALRVKGIVDIADFPDDYPLNGKQRTFVASAQSRERKIDGEAIKRELSALEFPLHFLDFETDNPAVPRFDGMRPYEQFPFQFSCHILYEKDKRLVEMEQAILSRLQMNTPVSIPVSHRQGPIYHHEFLHETTDDPRKPLLEALLKAVKDKGSIIAYNAPFEKKVLENLARWFPEYSARLQGMIDRLFDQLLIFRNYYTDYRFKGSNSIKAVLPVLVPKLSYDNLAVSGGSEAQVIWNEMIRLPDGVEKAKMAKDLKAYCGQDSWAMVEIHRHLMEVIEAD